MTVPCPSDDEGIMMKVKLSKYRDAHVDFYFGLNKIKDG